MVMETELADEQEVDIVDDDAEEVTDDYEADEQDDDPESGEDEDSDSEDIEWAEVEIDGKVYSVPADLRDGYMQQADYTRKTQQVAEQRKAYEEKLTKFEELSEAEQRAQAEQVAVKAALDRFEGVDWDLLERQNPNEANRLFRQYQQLKERSQASESKLAEARSQRESETQQLFAERFQQSMTELQQAIPNWGEEKAQELKSFAEREFGFSEEEFRSALHDPRQIKLVNLAMAGLKSAKAPRTPKPKPRPAAKVRGGGSTPKKGLDDRLSTEEWVKRREAQARRNLR